MLSALVKPQLTIPPAVRQFWHNNIANATPSSVTLTLAATLAGSMIMVLNFSGQAITSITDDAAGGSNAYAELGNQTDGSGSSIRAWTTTAASPKSAQNITIHYAAATTPIYACLELTTARTVLPLDGAIVGSPGGGAGTAAVSCGPSATPQYPGDLVIAFAAGYNTANHSTADSGRTFTDGITAGAYSFNNASFAIVDMVVGYLSAPPERKQTFSTTFGHLPNISYASMVFLLRPAAA